MPRSTATSHVRRSRRLGSCANCRKRHVKCDQVKPECKACVAAGIECQGYTSNLQWQAGRLHHTSDSTDHAGTRRRLYSEQSQLSMSTHLISQCSHVSVEASLDELDVRAKDLERDQTADVVIGPFGIIDARVPSHTISTPLTDDPPSTCILETALDPRYQTMPTPVDSEEDLGLNLPDSLQWSDLFDFGPVATPMPSRVVEAFHPSLLPANTQSPYEPLQSDPIRRPHHQELNSLNSSNTEIDDSLLLAQSEHLLRHFCKEVAGTMASIPSTNPPFPAANISLAVETLANLTYLERPSSYAKKANLGAVLACAAYNMLQTRPAELTGRPLSEDHATLVYEQAKAYLRTSLAIETSSSNKAKYKDQLTAIFGLLAFAIISGQQHDIRKLMTDAEYLLRSRGLAKLEISKSVRKLHHVYTWNRIVGESTYCLHRDEDISVARTEAELGRCLQPIDSSACLDNFLRLEQLDDDNANGGAEKEILIGLHDIHLRDSRAYTATLYIQIYGIPETWLSLVSRTTRLANILHNVYGKVDSDRYQEPFKKRCDRLESMVCNFAMNIEKEREADTNDQRKPSQHMLQALASSLVIFFYRSIRMVHPMILQTHVNAVVEALHHFNTSLKQHDVQGPGTAWPAFIAGCEAISNTRREALLDWIDEAWTSTGFQSYKEAKEMMCQVWRRRDQYDSQEGAATNTSLADINWINISREQQMWVCVC